MLDKLFGSKVRVKLLRLFLRNPKQSFLMKELRQRSREQTSKIQHELKNLVDIGLVRTKTARRQKHYTINPAFVLFDELKSMILKVTMASEEEAVKRVKAVSGIKLGVLTGVFVDLPNRPVDLLVVGNKINRAKFRRMVIDLEANTGKEINYTLMDVEEYSYRMDMFDKFLLDIFDKPNIEVVNKFPRHERVKGIKIK